MFAWIYEAEITDKNPVVESKNAQIPYINKEEILTKEQLALFSAMNSVVEVENRPPLNIGYFDSNGRRFFRVFTPKRNQEADYSISYPEDDSFTVNFYVQDDMKDSEELANNLAQIRKEVFLSNPIFFHLFNTWNEDHI